MILTLKDATFTGDILNKIQISVESERTTVKDLIAARVEAEVANYNASLPEYFKGLIQPSQAEQTLNGFRLKKKAPIDAEKQVFVAWEAFQTNGFFILIDDQQACLLYTSPSPRDA